MLNIITVLFCVAYCTGETSPKMWGSRVVSKPTGPSDTMSYRVGDYAGVFIYNGTKRDRITFDNGSCIVNQAIWGNPCQIGEGTVNITVNDVNMQNEIRIYAGSGDDPYHLSTYFLPNCKFPPLAIEEADPKTSFPLSRFVKGQQSFQLDFAVKGADSEDSVMLRRTAETLCDWIGVKVRFNYSDACVDLEKDEASDLRVFHGVFTPRSDVQWDTYTFLTSKSELAISVDYTQSGISPEVAECNQYGGVQFPTTSSGSALTYTISVMLGTAIMLTYSGG
uniref:Diagnostic protein TSES38 n=1 Tax=Taenia solium TaxID=6204 RepID=Q6EMR7_TAESO|nr:diagnostic protein TSES38 [Taenia solium]CAX86982.1 TSES38 diagnostic antigen [Taenia solium]|eukprot:TsM_000380000 transcript=TsM_000380000 gene=TsM_000380000